jgi:alkyl sulfatase BDS1-like metallo-beta-lactamase superfamily hydrolase
MSTDPISRFQESAGKSPEEAKFYWTGGPVEVAERTWFASLFSGSTTFETDEGLVVIDAGMARLGPGIASLVRQKTGAPVHTAIYTHGHVDHAYGLGAFLLEGQAKPRVIGHRNMPARFSRYVLTSGHNQALNARQFGGTVNAAENQSGYDTFNAPAIPPDVLYDHTLTIEVGGVRFELHHAKGETDDHTWIFCPERGVLCPGDLFIWAVPNAGNPQKVQRYPRQWAEALRKMATLGAEVLLPGHGLPIFGEERVHAALSETAELLELLHDRALAMMNAGATLEEIVRAVEVPAHLVERPYLQPIYDEPEFIVRNVWRLYGGWWDGDPASLKPAPREVLARELAALAGGARSLARRARELSAKGEHATACHLVEHAWLADRTDRDVREARAAVYRAHALHAASLMAKGIYGAAARESEEP